MENEQIGNAAFMEMAVKKMEAQDDRLSSLENQVKDLPGETGNLDGIKSMLQGIATALEKADLPKAEIESLRNQLRVTNRLLAGPRESRVLHHHHVQKSVWIITGLGGLLMASIAYLFVVIGRSNEYVAADTKYRFLEITSPVTLSPFLYSLDSLYKSGYPMLDSVMRWEQDEKELMDLERQLGVESSHHSQLQDREKQLLKERNVRRRM